MKDVFCIRWLKKGSSEFAGISIHSTTESVIAFVTQLMVDKGNMRPEVMSQEKFGAHRLAIAETGKLATELSIAPDVWIRLPAKDESCAYRKLKELWAAAGKNGIKNAPLELFSTPSDSKAKNSPSAP